MIYPKAKGVRPVIGHGIYTEQGMEEVKKDE